MRNKKATVNGMTRKLEKWYPFFFKAITIFSLLATIFATPYGSLPELIHDGVGQLCRTETEFLEAFARIEKICPQTCREWAMENFHYHKMAAQYFELYQKVLSGEKLNSTLPQATSSSTCYPGLV
jgi:hypothetical protein